MIGSSSNLARLQRTPTGLRAWCFDMGTGQPYRRDFSGTPWWWSKRPPQMPAPRLRGDLIQAGRGRGGARSSVLLHEAYVGDWCRLGDVANGAELFFVAPDIFFQCVQDALRVP